MAETDTQDANATQRTGQCLCGGVRISIGSARTHVGACHCNMCRRWSGGPLLAIDCDQDIKIEGDDNVRVYDSSPWAERAFCSLCGTNLFYRIKESQGHIVLAGLFDDSDGFDLAAQIFIDEKPAYYAFANETKTMTGAEVFEMYAPKP
ncbi:MAG: GFA family protein [Pseudomonadota bacterium]